MTLSCDYCSNYKICWSYTASAKNENWCFKTALQLHKKYQYSAGIQNLTIAASFSRQNIIIISDLILEFPGIKAMKGLTYLKLSSRIIRKWKGSGYRLCTGNSNIPRVRYLCALEILFWIILHSFIHVVKMLNRNLWLNIIHFQYLNLTKYFHISVSIYISQYWSICCKGRHWLIEVEFTLQSICKDISEDL